MIDQRVGDETVSDVALRAGRATGAARGGRSPRSASSAATLLRRKPSYRLVDVDEVPGLFPPISEMAAEAARLRDMHPAEVAGVVRALPLAQRRQLAAAMDDERLADLLEELPEEEQVRLIEGLDLDRLVGVLDEMEYDDLADLLGEMSGEQRGASSRRWTPRTPTSCAACSPTRRRTAGGMMTPELIVLGPTATVAEALAQIREPDWVVSIAAQVFVCQPPFKAPTGKLLGTAHVQRLLREPPSTELRHCVERGPGRRARGQPTLAVAELLASYDMLAVAVCDEAGPPARRGHRRRRARPPARASGWRQRGVTTRARTARAW